MNKQQLIDTVAKNSGLTKAKAGHALTSALKAIQDALASGDSVVIAGFGTFSVKNRPERAGRNPINGEPLTISASKHPTFKAGLQLKNAVNT